MAKTKGAARESEIVDTIAAILAEAQPTCFAFEGSCRHGLRAGLCLEGWNWHRADAKAAHIIERAFRKIGAVRPSWTEGQAEYAQGAEFCKNPRCRKPLIQDGPRPRLFCSEPCRRLLYERRAYWDNAEEERAQAKARWLASKARQPLRRCKGCGSEFHPAPPSPARPDGQQFCGIQCFNKSRHHKTFGHGRGTIIHKGAQSGLPPLSERCCIEPKQMLREEP